MAFHMMFCGGRSSREERETMGASHTVPTQQPKVPLSALSHVRVCVSQKYVVCEYLVSLTVTMVDAQTNLGD